MKRAIALIRISDEHRQGQGNSRQLQMERIHEGSKQAGFSIVRVFTIEETASKPLERRKFGEIKAYIEADSSIEALVVDRIDRFARNYTDLGWAMETARMGKGIEVYGLDERMSSRLHPEYFGILMSVAKNFSLRLSQRALADMPRLAKQGRWLYPAPPGYKNVRRSDGRAAELVVDEAMAWFVTECFERFTSHGYTGTDLARWAAEQGVKTRSGGRWTTSMIYHLLHNRAYLGEVSWNKQWFPGAHQPLIERAVFEQAQVILERGKAKGNRLGKPFLLKQIPLWCSHCNGPLTAQHTHGHGGTYVYYFCSRKRENDCRKTYQEPALLDACASVLQPIQFPKKVLKAWERDFDGVLEELQLSQEKAQIRLHKQAAKLEQQVSLALDHALADPAIAHLWSDKAKTLQAQLDQLRAKLGAPAIRQEDALNAMDFIRWASNLHDTYLCESEGLIRAGILKAVCSNLVVGRQGVRAEYKKPVLELVNYKGDSNMVSLKSLLQTLIPQLQGLFQYPTYSQSRAT